MAIPQVWKKKINKIFPLNNPFIFLGVYQVHLFQIWPVSDFAGLLFKSGPHYPAGFICQPRNFSSHSQLAIWIHLQCILSFFATCSQVSIIILDMPSAFNSVNLQLLPGSPKSHRYFFFCHFFSCILPNGPFLLYPDQLAITSTLSYNIHLPSFVLGPISFSFCMSILVKIFCIYLISYHFCVNNTQIYHSSLTIYFLSQS